MRQMNLCILRMLEDTFSLGMAHIIQSPQHKSVSMSPRIQRNCLGEASGNNSAVVIH